MPHLRPATTSPNSRALTPPETGATFTRVHVAGNIVAVARKLALRLRARWLAFEEEVQQAA